VYQDSNSDLCQITCAGNNRAQVRQEGLNEPLRQLAWKAQLRLTARFARLQGRGLQINKVCVAVARELAGFIWALARASAPARA
jgi:transposase